jgi:cytochrome b6-f complex iron-sulfur subunit
MTIFKIKATVFVFPSCYKLFFHQNINHSTKMERREFLEKIGIGAAFVLTASCLHSCKKEDTGPVDFTLNLDDADNTSLKTNGNFRIVNDVVVAKGNDGKYYAATVVCSHEQQKGITYSKTNNRYECSVHGAQFDLAGKGLNANGSKGLTIYQTTLTGASLRVFS